MIHHVLQYPGDKPMFGFLSVLVEQPVLGCFKYLDRWSLGMHNFREDFDTYCDTNILVLHSALFSGLRTIVSPPQIVCLISAFMRITR